VWTGIKKFSKQSLDIIIKKKSMEEYSVLHVINEDERLKGFHTFKKLSAIMQATAYICRLPYVIKK
jgi:hypothetical protein